MLFKLLLLFTVIPVLELAILIQVGRTIELGPTLAIVLLTGVVGAVLAKQQGLRTLARIQQSMAEGRLPTTELLNGLMILVAAAVLVTPGLLTDALGFALLLPPVRSVLRKLLTRYFKKHMVVVGPGDSDVVSPGDSDGAAGSRGFVDAEARVVSEEQSQNETPAALP